jgi:tetratricopeptide (TPR) repeat protein/tRNA A-37 threonylcarbamoyl transferase component Bud32
LFEASASMSVAAAGDPASYEGLKPGARLGNRYEIVKVLGVGGMGIVYRARDLTVQRDVALKVIRPEMLQNREAQARFRREILLASKVTHKNILRIFDLGESDGLSYISMNYVEGETLAHLVHREGALSPERVLPIAIQLCEALHEAHANGVIHRDLKPQNVLIDSEDQVYVADFGLSRSAEHGETMTQAGAVIGTVNYMAPEQARGEVTDHRGDIYSLGMVLYKTLTGERPFAAASSVSAMLMRVQEEIPPINEVKPDLPKWLSEIVSHALRRDPDERYQSAEEMLLDLEQRVGTKGPRSRPRRRRGRGWRPAAAVLLAVLVVVAGVLVGKRFLEGRQPAVLGAPKASLVLLPFQNSTGDPGYDWIGAGLPDLLRTDLRQTQALRLAGEDRVKGILEGLKLGSGGEFRPDSVQRVANLLGVEHALTGSLLKAGNQFRIEANLQRISGGTVASNTPIRVEGRGEDSIFSMVDDLTRRLRDDLGVAKGWGEQDRGVTDLSTSSVEALRLYGEGLELERAGNRLEAAKRLEAAIERDPEFAVARALLAETYERLGYADRAASQAEQAAQFQKDVSPFEAVRIQAIRARLDNDLEAAEQAYRELTRISPNSASAFLHLATVQEKRGDLQGALASLNRAVDLDAKHPDAHYVLGRVQVKMDNSVEALSEFNIALAMHLESRNDEGRATVLNGLGNTYLYLNRYDEAMDHYQKSLDIRERIGDRRGVSVVLANVAWVLDIEGRYDEAIQRVQQALVIQQEIGDHDLLAESYSNLGDLYQNSGRVEEALTAYQESMKILRDSGDEASLAFNLSSMGYINTVLGNYVEAFFFVKEALAKRREMGDKPDIILSLNDIGILEQIQGRYEEAIKYNLEGLSLAREIDDKEGLIVFAANLSNINEDQGEYGPALSRLADAEQTAREIEDPGLVATCLAYEGSTRRRLGDLDGAEQALAEAQGIAEELDNQSLLAKIQVYRGGLLLAQGRAEAAASALGDAVGIAGEVRDHRLGLLARLHAARATRSTRDLDAVAREAKESGLAPLVAAARLSLARLHLERSRPVDALREAEKAIEAGSTLRQRDLLFQAHHAAGLAFAGQNREDAALDHYQDALTALEEMRQALEAEALPFLLDRRETTDFGKDAGELLRSMKRPEDAARLEAALTP